MVYSENSSFLTFNGALIHCISDDLDYYTTTVSYSSTGELLNCEILVFHPEVKVYGGKEEEVQ